MGAMLCAMTTASAGQTLMPADLNGYVKTPWGNVSEAELEPVCASEEAFIGTLLGVNEEIKDFGDGKEGYILARFEVDVPLVGTKANEQVTVRAFSAIGLYTTDQVGQQFGIARRTVSPRPRLWGPDQKYVSFSQPLQSLKSIPTRAQILELASEVCNGLD